MFIKIQNKPFVIILFYKGLKFQNGKSVTKRQRLICLLEKLNLGLDPREDLSDPLSSQFQYSFEMSRVVRLQHTSFTRKVKVIKTRDPEAKSPGRKHVLPERVFFSVSFLTELYPSKRLGFPLEGIYLLL